MLIDEGKFDLLIFLSSWEIRYIKDEKRWGFTSFTIVVYNGIYKDIPPLFSLSYQSPSAPNSFYEFPLLGQPFPQTTFVTQPISS